MRKEGGRKKNTGAEMQGERKEISRRKEKKNNRTKIVDEVRADRQGYEIKGAKRCRQCECQEY